MQASVDPFVLTITYWLHMVATVVWIGGLTAVSLVLVPAGRKTLAAPAFGALLTQVNARLQGIGWFSLVVLFATGMFQMSASPRYEGFFAITNAWSAAILAKHLAVGLMILVSGYITWGLLPALKRISLLRAAGKTSGGADEARLRRREDLLLRANLVLSVLVLLLTAWARASA
jgi:uncharacterized membrane protein